MRASLYSIVLLLITFVLVRPVQSEGRLQLFDTYFTGSKIGKVQKKESAGFRVSWVHPKDEIFVEALLNYLERADKDLSPIFRSISIEQQQSNKVPVEIFPDLKSFSAVSELPIARFKATGTIALTLDQRLMILSPRNLSGGYPWASTVVHEYAHYLIREITPDLIPIWLHEGVAQLYQGYPYEKKVQLRPAQWGLFKKFKKKNALLSLETLKEPFPYRKDPEEAELAYVEALLFSKWLDEKCGAVNLIRSTAALKSLEKALTKCAAMTSAELNAKFIPQILGQIKIPEQKDVEFFARDFSSGSDPLEVESRKANRTAKNFAQLSSELFKQGRWRSSTFEMEKAISFEPAASPPSWRRQLALAYEKSGQRRKAMTTLEGVIHDYPDDAGSWYLIGAQKTKDQNSAEGWQAFLKAFFVNPFLDGLLDQMLAMKEKNPKLSFDLGD